MQTNLSTKVKGPRRIYKLKRTDEPLKIARKLPISLHHVPSSKMSDHESENLQTELNNLSEMTVREHPERG